MGLARLCQKIYLKDEKIWIQDKVGLAPYGYLVIGEQYFTHYVLYSKSKKKYLEVNISYSNIVENMKLNQNQFTITLD